MAQISTKDLPDGAPIMVQGIPTPQGPNGAVPLRREIRDMAINYPDEWNLYLQALTTLQNVSWEEWLSYYQLAGIHGRPYASYNGAGGKDGADNPGFKGYCTHSSILFPTWHRPYLALYEQVLYAIVQSIASKYSSSEGQARYLAAAQNFRLPYWDWALVPDSDDDYFPDLIANPQATVIAPGSIGKKTQIENPLESYVFNPVLPDDLGTGELAEWPYTVRYPTLVSGKPMSNYAQMRNILKQGQRNLRETVFNLLSSYKNYGPFSNDGWTGNPGQYGSLEGIHGLIHDEVGGPNGQMAHIPYAAFDPVFWLHHTNIDRYFAIWQALNPDSYVTPEQTQRGTFTTKAGTTEDAQSNLTPFWRDAANFWKSSDVRETAAFGYAYPETQSWNFDSQAGYQASVENAVVDLYGPSSLAMIIRHSQRGEVPKDAQIVPPQPLAAVSSVKSSVAQKPLSKAANGHATNGHATNGNATNGHATNGHTTNGSSSGTGLFDLAPNNKYLEWIFNVRVKKHALNGPFAIYAFLGDYDVNNPQSWPTEPNRVGAVAILGDSTSTGCGKCQQDRENEFQVTGQIPLTLALTERVLAHQLPDLTPESVIPFLQANLHWRVVQDGDEAPRGEVDGLVVSVISNEAELPSGPGRLPTFANEVTVHPDATTNRAGGSRGDNTGATRREWA